MGDQPKTARSSAASADDTLPSRPPTPPPAPPRQPVSLLQPSQKKKHKSAKVFRVFGSVFRSFPIITPATCKLPSLPGGRIPGDHHRSISGSRITGTLFGYRKGRVSLSMQENPRCLPTLVVELAIQTNVLQKDMSSGMLRIALECEKKPENGKSSLLEEPMWTMYVNGKKSGYGVKRDANEEDLNVMELLRPVSAGAGVLPGNTEVEGPDNELTYIRAHFERVVGSRDSETLYMLSPEGNNAHAADSKATTLSEMKYHEFETYVANPNAMRPLEDEISQPKAHTINKSVTLYLEDQSHVFEANIIKETVTPTSDIYQS
ncbi:hypothetical protein ACFE04_021412 [Oxalis oulophora]